MEAAGEYNRINLPEIIGAGYRKFWFTRKRYRIVKGGRGSKKSKTTALWFIYHIMKMPLANALVVRNTFGTLKDSCFADLKWAARRLGVFHLWRFNVSPLEARYLPTGQKILFRGFDDPDKLLSITVDLGFLCWVWIEEAYEIRNEEDFEKLDESIRGEMPEGYFKQITMTYNPWIYTHWTKKRFFDPKACPIDVFRDTTTYLCNEWLDDKDRQIIERLITTNPARARVVVYGDYGLPGGSYFEMWRDDIHVIKPFRIPDGWPIYAGIDYGNVTVAEFLTRNPQTGSFYVIGEWEVRSEEGHRVEGKERARRLRQYMEKHFWLSDVQWANKIIFKGDVNMFAKFAEFGDDVPISADYFRAEGIAVEQVVKKKSQDHTKFRIAYNEYFSELFFWKKDEKQHFIRRPRIYVFNTCKTLIETLPMLQIDPKEPREIDGYIEDGKKMVKIDHAYDAMKYAMTGFVEKYGPPTDKKEIKRRIWTHAKMSV